MGAALRPCECIDFGLDCFHVPCEMCDRFDLAIGVHVHLDLRLANTLVDAAPCWWTAIENHSHVGLAFTWRPAVSKRIDETFGGNDLGFPTFLAEAATAVNEKDNVQRLVALLGVHLARASHLILWISDKAVREALDLLSFCAHP